MSDTAAALLFLIPVASFLVLCYFLARFLIKQGGKDD